ncbi:MAG: PEP-CTERM sorting domain-containing protein [Planctomycetota bacterium]
MPFDTVIDVPPDAVTDGQVISSNTQVNVGDGGSLPFVVLGTDDNLSTNIELNVTGGSTAFIRAQGGSTVNISGGDVANLHLHPNASAVISGGLVRGLSPINQQDPTTTSLQISGGILDTRFRGPAGMELIGNDFQLDGVAYNPSTVSLNRFDNPNTIFTGTFADGSPFISGLPRIQWDEVQLTRVALPNADPTPIVIDGTESAVPGGVRAGQTLILRDGGVVANPFVAVDATINVEGGSFRETLDLAGTELNISGGFVGQRNGSNLFAGTVVNQDGGFFARSFNIWNDAEVNVSGGRFNSAFVEDGGALNLSGSGVAEHLRVEEGGAARLTGGLLGFSLEARAGSDVEFVGGEFLLNGQAIAGSTVTLTPGDVFTGTFENGATFIRTARFDEIVGARLTSAPLPSLPSNSLIIDGTQPVPLGLRAGQTATLVDGGELPFFFSVVDSTLNVAGGVIGQEISISRGTVNISGGTTRGFIFGEQIKVFRGGILNQTAGQVRDAAAYEGGVVNVTGGVSQGVSSLFAREGGEVNISGGSLTFNPGQNVLLAGEGGVVNIRGGQLGDGVHAEAGGTLNLFGLSFAINGVLIEELVLDTAFVVSDRDVELSGVLENGDSFSFSLNSNRIELGTDYFDEGSTLSVTLVPEPAALPILALATWFAAFRRKRTNFV